MRIQRHTLVLILAIALPGLSGGCRRREAIPPDRTLPPHVTLPARPDLTNLEEAVRKPLDEAHEQVAQLLRQSGVPQATLAEAIGNLGSRYHAHALFDTARPCYLEAQRLAAEDFRWPYYLAHVHHADNKIEESLDSFERASALRPGYVPTMVHRGRILLSLNRPDEAEQQFKQALAASPRNPAALAGLGDVAESRQELSAAVQRWEESLRLAPSASGLHYRLAMAYRRLGNDSLAKSHFEQQGEAEPYQADPLMEELRQMKSGARLAVHEGLRAVEAGRLDIAREQFQKAVDSDPEDSSAHLNLGIVLALTSNPDGAKHHLATAARDGSLDQRIKAHYNLGVVYARHGDDATALQHLDHALRLDGRQGLAHRQQGDVLMRLRRYDDAVDAYTQALSATPSDTNARFRRGLAYERIGDYGGALGDFEDAHQAEPDNLLLTYGLARMLAACPDDTLADGERATRLAEQLCAGQRTLDHDLTLAMAYARAGRFEDAAQRQREIFAVASRAGRQDLLDRLQQDLRGYEQREARRVPWYDDDPIFSPPRPQ